MSKRNKKIQAVPPSLPTEDWQLHELPPPPDPSPPFLFDAVLTAIKQQAEAWRRCMERIQKEKGRK